MAKAASKVDATANVSDRILALASLQAAGGGSRLLAQMEHRFGPIQTWWRSRRAMPFRDLSLRWRRLDALLDRELDTQTARGLDRAWARGYRPLEGRSLPALRELPDPPLFLLVKGRLPLADPPSVAVVGARRASGYGLRQARRLARETAAHGVPILSGLARGIDGAAHLGALEGGGLTVAVLGCGPDRCYPPEHHRLQTWIEEKGGVLTEHLPGTPPRPHHFPRRNRILVSLARALLVVEARIRSGTLTSVRWAADLGREVLVVPGPVDSPLSEGPLQLLREGATPVARADHILSAIGVEGGGGGPAPGPPPEISPAEGRLLALLAGGPMDLDDLVRLACESPGRVLALLLGLEVRGLVIREEGSSYRLGGGSATRGEASG